MNKTAENQKFESPVSYQYNSLIWHMKKNEPREAESYSRSHSKSMQNLSYNLAFLTPDFIIFPFNLPRFSYPQILEVLKIEVIFLKLKIVVFMPWHFGLIRIMEELVENLFIMKKNLHFNSVLQYHTYFFWAYEISSFQRMYHTCEIWIHLPWTTTWLLGTKICCPSVVCAYCRMVVPGWVAAALVMVNVCRPCTPSVPLLASCIAPPWVMATKTQWILLLQV